MFVECYVYSQGRSLHLRCQFVALHRAPTWTHVHQLEDLTGLKSSIRLGIIDANWLPHLKRGTLDVAMVVVLTFRWRRFIEIQSVEQRSTMKKGGVNEVKQTAREGSTVALM